MLKVSKRNPCGIGAATAIVAVALGSLPACEVTDSASDYKTPVREAHRAFSYGGVEYSAFFDDSAAPVHIAVTVCEAKEARTEHTIDCPAHAGYALVGGGARAFWTDGNGALVRESYPLENYRWRASSQDYLTEGQHYLRVYAIGLRLDGYPVKDLRKRIGIWSGHSTTFSLSQSFPGDYVLSGGFSVDPDRFMKSSKGIGGNGWSVTGTNHMQNLSAGITMYVMKMEGGILEGFGGLEVVQRSGVLEMTFSGVDRAFATAESGWSIVGIGGETQAFFGAGRLLSGIGMADGREVEVFSKDHGSPSGGTTRATFTQLRKVPESHGLCNPGAKLAATMDSCVASICAAHPSCCQTSWDSTCVSEVQTICGRDCSKYTCSTPGMDTAWWNENNQGDCYAYALNTTHIVDGTKDPGGSYWFLDTGTSARLGFAALGDGLIPSNATDTCPDNRTKVAVIVGTGGYHWLRQDSDTTWSHSYGYYNKDDFGNVITHPTMALWNNYDTVAGYYCSCSDSAQGQGHIDLETWPDDNPWGTGVALFGYPLLDAEAGPDLTVDIAGSAVLNGSVAWQEPPRASGYEITTTWKKMSGPGTVTFGDPSSPATTVSFSAPGVYLLRLSADCAANWASTFDEVEITVQGGGPCAGLCVPQNVFTFSGSYQSGNLGTGMVCRETTSVVHGGNCGNFIGDRKLLVNGTPEICNYQNWAVLPAKRNGGYCVQTTAGNQPWAYFTLWQ